MFLEKPSPFQKLSLPTSKDPGVQLFQEAVPTKMKKKER